MSSWRALLLRVGDKCPEYGGAVDYKEHIVSSSSYLVKLHNNNFQMHNSFVVLIILSQETCYGVLWREFEHSKDEISEVMPCSADDLY
ncbi:hypothetical protein GW17_00013131 [Ensete ventricosum]|nr:hypothetical protein GW17_00013131 [Ensete ventricosum]